METSSEQLTFFAAESLASLSVWPGSRQANQMTVTSGLRLLESLPSCDRGLWWLRTLLASSSWHSTRCLLTWKHKVTPAGRSYYLLRVSMPRTDAIASGLWPSPKASAQSNRGMKPSPSYINGTHGWNLPQAVGDSLSEEPHRPWGQMWPTPVANDDNKSPEAHMAMKQRMKGGPRNTITSLQVAVKASERMWMTPKARDADFGTPSTSGRSREMSTHLATQVMTRMLPTPRHEGFDAGAHRGKPDSLHAVAKLCPTPRPCTGDRSLGMNRTEIYDWMEEHGGKMLPTPNAADNGKGGIRHKGGNPTLIGAVSGNGEKAKLNPDWVCRMMGYPDGWLNIPTPDGTDAP